ncbi:MAG: hypothetical protein M3487_02685, partial [Actinomycetota bacterium]|nr:hypothetical protein [Actinomycetota bacterium]
MDTAELVLELKATREIALPDDELRDLVAFLIEQGGTREEIRSAWRGRPPGRLGTGLGVAPGSGVVRLRDCGRPSRPGARRG